MKKQISRLFLAVFMITALLFCMNMTAFAAEATFTGNETDFSASVNMGNTSVNVIVHDDPKTDINVGDKLIVTGDRDNTILHNDASSLLDEAEFVTEISSGSMSVEDDNGEKVVHTTGDINTNMIPLDYDTDDDGSVTTYVTQKFSQSQLSGVMGANQTQDLILKTQLANPGAGEDKDPEVTVINKNQIQAVGGGYTVTVSFDGIRNWIFGLVNRTITMDYDLTKINNPTQMSAAYAANADIALLASNVPIQEGGAMFKIPDGSAKSNVIAENATRGNDRGYTDVFGVAHSVRASSFDTCETGYVTQSKTEANAWYYECEGGYAVQFGVARNGITNYSAYTFKHAEFTADDIVFELKDKELIYLPGGEKNFTWDDVELYYLDADGEKLELKDYSDFIDCHMSGKDSDGTISVCVGGIYKTINLGEQPKPFFITPSTVSYLIKTGYYPAFLSNENSAASFTIDFAQDAAHPENNTIYITAEPNADGKFEPTTMQFNSTLIRHLSQALVNTVSLTVGDNEVVISYASVAELVKKYDGVSFILTVDGDKVTATIMNKQGIVTDVTSELEMTVNKK